MKEENWKADDDEKYNFLLILDKEDERYKYYQELIVTSLPTLISLTLPLSSFSSSNKSLNSGSSLNSSRKIRSLNYLYKITNSINNDVTLYCYIATCDPIVFE
jgi:hypothetical protein